MDMKDCNSNATKKAPTARCLEVLISRRFIANSENLLWTLTVYSLENQPVKKNRALHHSEIFHFMVFDWERTIKALLEKNKVPYSIIQFFTPDSIFSESPRAKVEAEVDEMQYLSAVSELEETDLRTMAALPSIKANRRETADSAV